VSLGTGQPARRRAHEVFAALATGQVAPLALPGREQLPLSGLRLGRTYARRGYAARAPFRRKTAQVLKYATRATPATLSKKTREKPNDNGSQRAAEGGRKLRPCDPRYSLDYVGRVARGGRVANPPTSFLGCRREGGVAGLVVRPQSKTLMHALGRLPEPLRVGSCQAYACVNRTSGVGN
jgi:hypothetical protein